MEITEHIALEYFNKYCQTTEGQKILEELVQAYGLSNTDESGPERVGLLNIITRTFMTRSIEYTLNDKSSFAAVAGDNSSSVATLQDNLQNQDNDAPDNTTPSACRDGLVIPLLTYIAGTLSPGGSLTVSKARVNEITYRGRLNGQ